MKKAWGPGVGVTTSVIWHRGRDICYKKWKVKVKVKSLSHVWLFATPWTVAYQAPPSMGFSRQECLSGLPFPSPGDLPNPGIEPRSPALQADALPSEPPGKPCFKKWRALINHNTHRRIYLGTTFLTTLIFFFSLAVKALKCLLSTLPLTCYLASHRN